VVEKPLGSDLQSFLDINGVLTRHFHENQIFRIDHFLGKETVQNILALLARDANGQDALTITSAGYVGSSDGWQDFRQHGTLTWRYESAGPGNIALCGQLTNEALLALGLAGSREAAATLAGSALQQSFDDTWEMHCRAWDDWHHASRPKASRCPMRWAACSVPRPWCCVRIWTGPIPVPWSPA
jgi:hypothetical protein